MSAPVIEPGYCQCGCGSWVGFWEQDNRRLGRVKGQPKRFVHGHNAKLESKSKPEYAIEDRGFDTPCWVWLKSKKPSGHGQVMKNGTPVLAHRYYYEQEKGPIPEGVQLLQLCGVRACVNPEHQEPVSYSERVRRGAGPKLNRDQAKNIRREAKGTGYYEKVSLAEKHGISIVHLYAIVRGSSWAD